MFKRILVPLDGSSLAEQALKPALALARRSGGQILLLRIPAFQQAIVPDPAGQALVWPEIDGENSRIEAADYLRNIQRINPQITMRTLVIDGDEASTIIGYPFKKESSVELSVDDVKFTMFTNADGAWADSPGTEKQIVAAMKAGKVLKVKGTSWRGTETEDTYSLNGVTAAMDAIDGACK